MRPFLCAVVLAGVCAASGRRRGSGRVPSTRGGRGRGNTGNAAALPETAPQPLSAVVGDDDEALPNSSVSLANAIPNFLAAQLRDGGNEESKHEQVRETPQTDSSDLLRRVTAASAYFSTHGYSSTRNATGRFARDSSDSELSLKDCSEESWSPVQSKKTRRSSKSHRRDRGGLERKNRRPASALVERRSRLSRDEDNGLVDAVALNDWNAVVQLLQEPAERMAMTRGTFSQILDDCPWELVPFVLDRISNAPGLIRSLTHAHFGALQHVLLRAGRADLAAIIAERTRHWAVRGTMPGPIPGLSTFDRAPGNRQILRHGETFTLYRESSSSFDRYMDRMRLPAHPRDERCNVCLSVFEDSVEESKDGDVDNLDSPTIVYALPCGDILCEICARRALAVRAACPFCRAVVSNDLPPVTCPVSDSRLLPASAVLESEATATEIAGAMPVGTIVHQPPPPPVQAMDDADYVPSDDDADLQFFILQEIARGQEAAEAVSIDSSSDAGDI